MWQTSRKKNQKKRQLLFETKTQGHLHTVSRYAFFRSVKMRLLRVRFLEKHATGVSWGLTVQKVYSRNYTTCIWLVVSTHLKNISQIGNLPQIGVKKNNIWNHHLGMLFNTTILYKGSYGSYFATIQHCFYPDINENKTSTWNHPPE